MSTGLDLLGPLPTSDAQSELQRESIAAVHSIVSGRGLVLRDERADDYGVDATLEAIIDGRATNCRAHAQLKARSGLTANADGSLSVAVATANLNYLLNGPSAIYILYTPEDRRLRYAFARDEEARICGATAHWKAQANVTLRFEATLDETAIPAIRTRIVAEAQLHRKLHGAVAALAPIGDPVRIELSVDEHGVRVRTPEEALDLLRTNGMALVSWGFPTIALDLAALVPAAQFSREAKLQLIRGFAEFTNRNYVAADPHLRHALARRQDLDADDQRFLAFLMSAVAMARGEINSDEFRARSVAWRADAPVYLQLQYDILHLWTLHTEAEPGPERDAAVARLVAVLNQAQQHADVPVAVKQHAKLLWFFFEAQNLLAALTQAVAASREPFVARFAYGGSPDRAAEQVVARLASWRTELHRLLEDVDASGHRPLMCEALFSRDLCDVMIVGQLKISSAMAQRPPPAVDAALVERIRRTRELADKWQQPEFSLRALLIESDVEDLRGNLARANELSQRALETATALCYADIARVAGRQLTGDARNSTLLREIAELHAEGGLDRFLAKESDDEIAQNGAYACELLQISTSRLANVIDAIRCERAQARERLQWCRHIAILEYSAHTANRVTLFAQPPVRCGYCAHHNSRSLVSSKDWAALLSTFKATRCRGCAQRDPFDKPPAAPENTSR